MPDRIPPHRHCKECGKPISLDQTYCSNQCESASRAKLRRRRNQLYTYYLLMVILLLAALIYLGYFR